MASQRSLKCVVRYPMNKLLYTLAFTLLVTIMASMYSEGDTRYISISQPIKYVPTGALQSDIGIKQK